MNQSKDSEVANKRGRIDFISTIKEMIDDDSLFSLDIVQMVVNDLWSEFGQKIIYKYFSIFIAQLVLTHIYFYIICEESDQQRKAFELSTLEFWLRNAVLAVPIY